MKRAICLIIILTALGIGCGLWADISQRSKARQYIEGMYTVREAVLNGDMGKAASEQAYWHALWQYDEKWLNYLLSHELTREVSASMMRLETSLSQGWSDEALKSLDDVMDAFTHIEHGDSLTLENVL